MQNTGQRRGETGATAVADAPAGAGAYGETVPYSKELMEQIGQRAVQRAKQGKKIDNPDVLP